MGSHKEELCLPQASLTLQFLIEQCTPGTVHTAPNGGWTPPPWGAYILAGDRSYNPNIQSARVPWKNKVQSKDGDAEERSRCMWDGLRGPSFVERVAGL